MPIEEQLEYLARERELAGVAPQGAAPPMWASALFALNVQAVRQRYSDADQSGMIPAARAYQPTYLPPGEIWHKLRCYLYQCTEGDVPETPLYRYVEAIKTSLAEHLLADRLPVKPGTWN